MVSSIKNVLQTPLEAEYRELRKASSDIRNPAQALAQRRSAPENRPVEDIVSLSSGESQELSPQKTKRSQPVTPEEKSALLFGFSVYG